MYLVDLWWTLIIFKKSFQEDDQKQTEIKLNNCQFIKEKLEYLGFIFTKKGIKPQESKIKAV